MGLGAFMDDTTHLLGNGDDYLLSTLIPNAQFNIDLWQGLILASGSALNLSRCSWTPFLWDSIIALDILPCLTCQTDPCTTSQHPIGPAYNMLSIAIPHNKPSEFLEFILQPTVAMTRNSAFSNNVRTSTLLS